MVPAMHEGLCLQLATYYNRIECGARGGGGLQDDKWGRGRDWFTAEDAEDAEKEEPKDADWCIEQQVNAIFDSTDLQCLHLILFGDAAKIGPDALLNVRCYPGLPLLRAEDDVIMQRRVGVRHGFLRRYAMAWDTRSSTNRGLTPTARRHVG
jgi:hypothetical protein